MKYFVCVALLTVLYCALPVKANTLRAIVVEVSDGKTIWVENTGRRIKVVLKAAESPEKDQPYADVARQHLAGFVLNHQVTVEYTGLGEGALLIARVFCDDRDIGLQMIRDGVAWFDRSYESELGAQVQRRADSSNRRTDAAASAASKRAVAANETSAAKTATASTLTKPKAKTDAGKWPLFSPSDNLFSIRMPGGAREFSAEVDVPRGRSINATFRWVHHLKIAYLTVWATGPYQNEIISTLFDRTVDALNDAAASHGLSCEFFQEKDTSMSGYAGRQYRVRGCYLNGAIRNYFKIEGKTLKVIYVGVLSEIPDDPAVREFLESFTINN